MSGRDEIKTPGEKGKLFRVFRTINNEPYECVGEYDTAEEVNAHRGRLDHSYRIEVGRKFMTQSEFHEWAKNQKQNK
ncbi:MAG: hypothetical protein WA322_20050 [Pseudolabrys sp.]